MEQSKQVNAMWFFAIISECVLNYRTGLINRQGSPFAQFKKVFPECPKNKKDAILWINDLYEKNISPEFSRKPKTLERLVTDIKEKNVEPKKLK